MLDKMHTLPPLPSDTNAYEFDELNGHCIVIAYLPAGVYGTVPAATCRISRAFNVPTASVWTDGGNWRGVPGEKNDIQLGDVVVSKPGQNHSRMIQSMQEPRRHDAWELALKVF
jgi:hypothetical protein